MILAVLYARRTRTAAGVSFIAMRYGRDGQSLGLVAMLVAFICCLAPGVAHAANPCDTPTIIDTTQPITGTAGDDVIVGTAGADTINGNGGNDVICGGPGNDTIDGGDGNDTLVGESGNDQLDGGAGVDVASYADRPSTASIVATLANSFTLPGATLSALIRGEAAAGARARVGQTAVPRGTSGQGEAGEFDSYFNLEGITGGAGPDVLTAGAGPATLSGGPGDDQLQGASAGDTIYGGDGADTLVGNAGNDYLDGGPGADGFQGSVGDDVLEARDGAADAQLSCGDGVDELRADIPGGDDPLPRADCEVIVGTPPGGTGPDTDADGVPDRIDNCPVVANATQSNGDHDALGDACDLDNDGDGVADTVDNCPKVANADQADADKDKIGNACETLPSGSQKPVAGVRVNVKVLSGEVFVKLPSRPAGRSLLARAAAAGLDPGFIPLKGSATIPVGASVDTRRGRMTVRGAAAFPGRPRRTTTGTFSAGIFQIKQDRRRSASRPRPRTDISLVSARGAAAICRPSAPASSLKGVVRSLVATLKGVYRTIGVASIASVTNATLSIKDRCDGTVTQVGKGRATVFDKRRHRTVIVRAGQAYLAKAPSFGSIKGRTSSARARSTGRSLAARSAAAAAPANDNYLASTPMMDAGGVKRSFSEIVDTSAATTQFDLFNPDKDGMPFAGGPPENTRCGQAQFGATVWYDFAPEVAGGAEIVANGYDTVVTVYEYDVRTAKIVRTVTCASTPGVGETVDLPRVKRATAYTIQVGGAGAATGRLDFKFNFFGDRDEDGIFDETPDKCPTTPGVREAGGCPPELRASPSAAYRDAPGGPRLTRVVVSGVPVGARVEARCRRCGISQSRIATRSVVTLPKLTGRVVRAGAKLEILVTRARTASGRFKYGAIGNYFAYTARARGFSPRVTRCLKPGSKTPRTRCT
jgi:hypothetical protein